MISHEESIDEGYFTAKTDCSELNYIESFEDQRNELGHRKRESKVIF